MGSRRYPQPAEARHGGAIAAGVIGGLAVGALVGAAASAPYYGYAPGYYYGGPAYGYGGCYWTRQRFWDRWAGVCVAYKSVVKV